MINRVPLEKILVASDAVFSESKVDGRDMAFAVVDEAGGLIFGIRYENTATRVLTHSIRKAYTSAIMRRDTITFRDEDKEREKTLADWGDTNLTHLVGGVVIEIDGEWFGGMAVGGNSTERDDEIARIALEILTKT